MLEELSSAYTLNWSEVEQRRPGESEVEEKRSEEEAGVMKEAVTDNDDTPSPFACSECASSHPDRRSCSCNS